jgi:hypothetical protein
MVGREALDELQARKRALVLESSLNRLALQADWEDVRAAAGWMGSASRAFRQVRPWLLLLAPLAGLLVARASGQPRGLFRRLLSVLRWVRPLLGAWGGLKGVLAEVRSQPPAGD